MSVAATRVSPTGAHADAALRILKRLLHGFAGGADLRLWNDSSHSVGQGPSAFTLVLRDPMLLRSLVTTHGPVLLADAYFRGQIDVEGDLYSALALKGHFEGLALPWRDKLAMLLDAWRLPTSTNSRNEPANAGTLLTRLAHRFTRRHTRHSEVQRNKLEHICRKLRLQRGERLLDIGCGWGALVCWAAKHYGVRAYGITLSQAQHDFAQQRIADEGLQALVTVELRDYRDLQGEAVYDKVASVGMFEHVGLANMPTYLAAVQRVLRPGGLFLNHGITHDEEGWNRTVATEFINRYVFPDGEFDCVSNIQLGMERAGFEIQDVEALRRHYALTLRHWVQRLEANRDAALAEVDEPTYRVWRLYMAACSLEFEAGGTGIYQILASRRGVETSLPLTRHDLYAYAHAPIGATLPLRLGA